MASDQQELVLITLPHCPSSPPLHPLHPLQARSGVVPNPTDPPLTLTDRGRPGHTQRLVQSSAANTTQVTGPYQNFIGGMGGGGGGHKSHIEGRAGEGVR